MRSGSPQKGFTFFMPGIPSRKNFPKRFRPAAKAFSGCGASAFPCPDDRCSAAPPGPSAFRTTGAPPVPGTDRCPARPPRQTGLHRIHSAGSRTAPAHSPACAPERTAGKAGSGDRESRTERGSPERESRRGAPAPGSGIREIPSPFPPYGTRRRKEAPRPYRGASDARFHGPAHPPPPPGPARPEADGIPQRSAAPRKRHSSPADAPHTGGAPADPGCAASGPPEASPDTPVPPHRASVPRAPGPSPPQSRAPETGRAPLLQPCPARFPPPGRLSPRAPRREDLPPAEKAP